MSVRMRHNRRSGRHYTSARPHQVGRFFFWRLTMTRRMYIAFEVDEHEALLAWARAEFRDPQQQLRQYLRQELTRRGYMPADNTQRHDDTQRTDRPAH